MFNTEALFGQFGISAAVIEDFLTKTGLIGLLAGIIFLCVRLQIFRFVSVDSGTELIRARWGKERYYSRWHFRHETGRLIRLGPGFHFLIRGMHDSWEISKKRILLRLEQHEQPFDGRVMSFDSITFAYMVIATDDRAGDQKMLTSFLCVRNIDRDNQESKELDDLVEGLVIDELRQYLSDGCEANSFGAPIIKKDDLMQRINRSLDTYGVELDSFSYSAPVWKDGQLHFDGLSKIADGLAGTPAADKIGNVVELAKSEPA